MIYSNITQEKPTCKAFFAVFPLFFSKKSRILREKEMEQPLQKRDCPIGVKAAHVLGGTAPQKIVRIPAVVETLHDAAEHSQRRFLPRRRTFRRRRQEQGKFREPEPQREQFEIRQQPPAAGKGIEPKEKFIDRQIL